jgi:hypothetical protein
MTDLRSYAGGKIIIRCECGINRQYDAWQMIERAGNPPMPDLLARLARANECPKVKSKASVYDRCKMRFDIEAMRASVKP